MAVELITGSGSPNVINGKRLFAFILDTGTHRNRIIGNVIEIFPSYDEDRNKYLEPIGYRVEIQERSLEWFHMQFNTLDEVKSYIIREFRF